MTSASRLLSTRGPLTPLNRPSGSKNSVQFLLGGRRLDQLLVQSGTRLSNWSTNGREKMCSIAEELHLSRESSLNTGDGWMTWVYVTARKFLLSQFLTRFSAIILEVNFTEPDFLPCAPWESESFFNQLSLHRLIGLSCHRVPVPSRHGASHIYFTTQWWKAHDTADWEKSTQHHMIQHSPGSLYVRLWMVGFWLSQ